MRHYVEIKHVCSILISGISKKRALGASPHHKKSKDREEIRKSELRKVRYRERRRGRARGRRWKVNRILSKRLAVRHELCTGKRQSATMAPSIIDIISKKRDGLELSRDEIETFVRMVTDGTAQDCQIGMHAFFSWKIKIFFSTAHLLSQNSRCILVGLFVCFAFYSF